MLELSSLAVIGILYIIPLNIPLYSVSSRTAQLLFHAGEGDTLIGALFYILYTSMLFASVYGVIRFMVFEGDTCEEKNKKIKQLLTKHKRGQKHINLAAKIIILLVLLLHILFLRFDIKLLIMALLCVTFIYSDFTIGDRIKVWIKRNKA